MEAARKVELKHGYVYQVRWDYGGVDAEHPVPFYVPQEGADSISEQLYYSEEYPSSTLPQQLTFICSRRVVWNSDFPPNSLGAVILSNRLVDLLYELDLPTTTRIPVLFVDDESLWRIGRDLPSEQMLNRMFSAMRLENPLSVFDYENSEYTPMRSNPNRVGGDLSEATDGAREEGGASTPRASMRCGYLGPRRA